MKMKIMKKDKMIMKMMMKMMRIISHEKINSYLILFYFIFFSNDFFNNNKLKFRENTKNLKKI
jgi:hypothetical protein